jgi:uncharacterized protein YndB with AHSA1/START domain
MGDQKGSAVVSKAGDRKIVIKRYLRAPRELVWEAHHDVNYVSKWWGLRGAQNHITEIDLRPGGRWRFGQRNVDGSEVIFCGTYVELVAPARFTYTKGWPALSPGRAGGAADSGDSTITISFEETTDGTLVILTCEFSSEQLRNQVAEQGMGRLQESYDRMDDLLATLLQIRNRG